jgi:hypothetical protein
MGPSPRAKVQAAADYLAVAPKVVAVARDIDLDRCGFEIRAPRDAERLRELAERYNLASPLERLTTSLRNVTSI